MNLSVSTEQRELRESVRRFLTERAPLTKVRELMETADGTDPDVWRQASAQLGLPGIAVPEEYGGAGFSFAEQAIVLEELGAALFTGPYLASAVLAATALLASDDQETMKDLLPGIAAGETIATLAFTEDGGSWDPASIRLTATKERPPQKTPDGGSTATRASSSTAKPPTSSWPSRPPEPTGRCPCSPSPAQQKP